MYESDNTLHVELQNKRPVELKDLTLSLLALGQAYEDYVVDAGHESLKGNVKLYVKELRSGSIIAELTTHAEQAHAFLKDLDVYAGFLANLGELTGYFSGRATAKAELGLIEPPPSKKQAEQLNQILEPVAKDGGSQLILQVNGDINIHPTLQIGSLEASAVQNNIRRYLSASSQSNSVYPGEVLYLQQMRDDPKHSTGDRGVIDRISPKAVPLNFVSEEVKRTILDQPDNPFRKAFIVDVDVRTVEGKPALYKILSVTQTIDRLE